jgi:TRAP-type C4-dicarboxylate transport system permease small subunit
MKGLLVLTCGGLMAATALVYGQTEMGAAFSAVSYWPGEPATLLLSGSALLGAAGALRRCSF